MSGAFDGNGWHPETVQGEPVDDSVSLFIPGIPIPQGSKKGFIVGKRVVIVDDNAAKLKPWRAIVANHADIGRTFTGPVAVTITFYLPRPQRPRWELPAVKPDVDKLVRAAFDGLTDGGLLEDDARVTDLRTSKRYAVDGEVGMRVDVSAA